ncbi:MAG: hypothetical protein LRZ85_06580 [Alphaproteobacteria bacterium]|nr:hypothetical protein [Alphaproteobacteria bacterium]
MHERTEQALFFPPLKFTPALKAAFVLEKYGRYVWPLGGVHIVEASKQLYAPIDKSRGSKVKAAVPVMGRKAQPAV